jgi:hypothetical protein
MKEIDAACRLCVHGAITNTNKMGWKMWSRFVVFQMFDRLIRPATNYVMDFPSTSGRSWSQDTTVWASKIRFYP